MSFHVHEFNLDSKSINNHRHRILGYTENPLGFGTLHFHHFWGICSYNGHTHYYSGFTSLPVKTANGHIHKIEGVLELNNFHEHKFFGYTFEDVQYISKRIPKAALI